jgi:hypothetical protein
MSTLDQGQQRPEPWRVVGRRHFKRLLILSIPGLLLWYRADVSYNVS